MKVNEYYNIRPQFRSHHFICEYLEMLEDAAINLLLPIDVLRHEIMIHRVIKS